MKIRHFTALFLINLMTSLTAFGSEIKAEMRQASEALTELMPYIYQDERFRDPVSKPEIEQNIDKLIAIISRTPALLNEHAVTMSISQQSLLAALQQARTLYGSGAYSTAQYVLSGVPIVCSSCHIQDGQQASLTQKMDRRAFANDFSYAEFNYYLRNYTDAKKAYQAHMKEPEVQQSRIQAGKTLERLLDINLITANSTEPALQLITDMKHSPKLDLDVKQTLALWEKGLNGLSYESQTITQLENAIYDAFNEQFTLEHEFIFNEENRPKALVWRLQLHKALRTGPNTQDTARLLYLLSILERALGDQVDVSLANLYLKECVRLDVKKYSGKCISEYENHLYFYYGGSSGEHLPAEVHHELQQLKTSLRSDH